MRRFAPAAAAWAASAALVLLWLASRGSLELNPVSLGAGIVLSLRLDAIAFPCALAALLGAAALLTFRPGQRWTLLLAVAAALLAVGSADLLLTAAATGLAVLFVLDATGGEEGAGVTWPAWAAVILIAWAGVSLQVVGGTAGYGAAPASALNAGIAALVLLAAAALIGAIPVRPAWPPAAWIALPPIGYCLLLRVFTLGDGRLPHPALYVALGLAGILAWGIAAWRAAAAPSARDFAALALPAMGGAGLLAAGAGVQLGAVAVVFALFATALSGALNGSVSYRRRADAMIVAALLAGLPPGLGFVARLVAVQAQLESDQAVALLIVPATLAWLLWLFAGLRAVSLPAAGGQAPRWLAPLLGGVSAIAGLAAGPLAAGIAQPAAAAAALGRAGPRLSAGLAGLEPASGGWPALLLGGLVVVAAVAAALLAGARLPTFAEPLPPPLPRPGSGWRLPEAPRLPRLAPFEAMATGRRPLLWAVLIAALAIVVTRAL